MKIPIGRIPKFIKARSPEGLQRLMMRVHSKLGYGVNFHDKYIYGRDKEWHIAWYYDNEDITLLNVEEKIADNNS